MNSGTLVVMPDIGAMRVRVTPDFKIDVITRTDSNGMATVRLREGQLPRPNTDTFIFDDFEAAAGSISYTFSGATASTPGTPRVSFTLSGQMTIQSPWLSVPIMASYSQPIDTVLSYDADISGHASVHEPLGRTDPIVILRKMGLRKGSMELWAGPYGRTKDILGSLKRGEVMMLRQPEHEGMDMYFVAESASIITLSTEEGKSLFSVSIQYIEVQRPRGPIASALGWDFSQIASSNSSFMEIASKYPDFQSLALNEAS